MNNKLFSLIQTSLSDGQLVTHDIVMHNWCPTEGINSISLLILFTDPFNYISNYIYFHQVILETYQKGVPTPSP